MLTAFVEASVADPGAVDDIWQETMLTAWQRWDDYDRSRPFGAWLRGIAKKNILAWSRRRKAASLSVDSQSLDYLDGMFARVNRLEGDTFAEKLDALRACIQELAGKTRSIVGDGWLWIGGNQNQLWMVPHIGSVRTGPPGLSQNWLKRQTGVDAPFLTTAAILEHMSEFYKLSLMPSVSHEGPDDAVPATICDHVVGTRRASTQRALYPDRIELLADQTQGTTRRVDLFRNRDPEAVGLIKATVELVNTPDVSPDFFSHTGHLEGAGEFWKVVP